VKIRFVDLEERSNPIPIHTALIYTNRAQKYLNYLIDAIEKRRLIVGLDESETAQFRLKLMGAVKEILELNNSIDN